MWGQTRLLLRSLEISRGRRVVTKMPTRGVMTTPSGAIVPEPKQARLAIFGVFFTVMFGLFSGAMISKKIANFLEENDLFVPSDDDDDDD